MACNVAVFFAAAPSWTLGKGVLLSILVSVFLGAFLGIICLRFILVVLVVLVDLIFILLALVLVLVLVLLLLLPLLLLPLLLPLVLLPLVLLPVQCCLRVAYLGPLGLRPASPTARPGASPAAPFQGLKPLSDLESLFQHRHCLGLLRGLVLSIARLNGLRRGLHRASTPMHWRLLHLDRLICGIGLNHLPAHAVDAALLLDARAAKLPLVLAVGTLATVGPKARRALSACGGYLCTRPSGVPHIS